MKQAAVWPHRSPEKTIQINIHLWLYLVFYFGSSFKQFTLLKESLCQIGLKLHSGSWEKKN